MAFFDCLLGPVLKQPIKILSQLEMASMKKLRKIFFSGLLTFLPIAVTIYVVYAGVQIVDNFLGSVIRAMLPRNFYVPGLGILLTIVLIFILGLLLNNLITGTFLHNLEKRLTEVPFIKAIYSPLRDLMNMFSKSDGKDLKSVVLVEITPEHSMLGLVTRDNFDDLEKMSMHLKDRVSVYLPLSYGLGGFTILVDTKKIRVVDIPVDKALSLAITGWVKTEKKSE